MATIESDGKDNACGGMAEAGGDAGRMGMRNGGKAGMTSKVFLIPP